MSLLAELIGSGPVGGGVRPPPGVAFYHDLFTEPADAWSDVKNGHLPRPLPYVSHGRRALLAGLLQYECIYYHTNLLLQTLLTWETAARRRKPSAHLAQVLIRDRAATAVMVQLVSEVVLAHPNSALSDAMVASAFKAPHGLFLLPGDIDLATVRHVYTQSGRADAIHEDPYTGVVLCELHRGAYEKVTALHDTTSLWPRLIEDVWTAPSAAQSIADGGTAPPLEPWANYLLYELVQFVMIDKGCPPEYTLQQNSWLATVETRQKQNHVRGVCPPLTPADALSKSAAGCYLVHAVRRNFVALGDGTVLDVPTFPAAILVWFALCPLKQVREQYMPAQFAPLVRQFLRL
jgi:hypothetical protein